MRTCGPCLSRSLSLFLLCFRSVNLFGLQQMMGAVDKFLYKLENFDKENIPSKVIKALQQYLNVRSLP